AHFSPFAWVYSDLATIAAYEGNGAAAIDLITRGAQSETVGDACFNTAFLLYFLAACGRGDEARAIADATIAKAEATGVPCSIIIAYWGKSQAWATADPALALQCAVRAAALARETG